MYDKFTSEINDRYRGIPPKCLHLFIIFAHFLVDKMLYFACVFV